MSLAWEAGKGSLHVESSRVDWVQAGSLGEKAGGARGLGWEHSDSRPEPLLSLGEWGAGTWRQALCADGGPLFGCLWQAWSRAGLRSQQGHRTGSGEALLSGFRPPPAGQLRPSPGHQNTKEHEQFLFPTAAKPLP